VSNSGCIASRANLKIKSGDLVDSLEHRTIEAPLRWLTQLVVSYIAHHSHDLNRFLSLLFRIDPDLPSNWIASMKIEACHRLVDHCYLRRGLRILWTNFPPQQDRNSNDAEVIWPNLIVGCLLILIIIRCEAFNDDAIARFGSAKQAIFGERRASNSRNSGKGIDELPAQSGNLWRLVSRR